MNKQNRNNLLFEDTNRLDYYIASIHKLEEENQRLKEEIKNYKKLHGELTESFDEFITLQKLSEVINSTLDEEVIANSFLKLVKEVIPFKEGVVFLKNEDEYKGYPASYHPDFLPLFESLEEEGVLQWLYERKSTIILPVDELILQEIHRWHGNNLLLVPLLAFNDELGAMIALSDKPQEAFQYKDFELVNMLAFQAAMAYHHAKIFKKLKTAHENLKKSQAELLRTIKLATVGELSGGIAHEINNPLQIILGNIQLGRIKKNYDEVLQVIEEQSLRISNIVKSLLTFVRQDYKDIYNEYIIPSQVIKKSYGLVRGQLEKNGIKVHLENLKETSSIQLNTNYCQQIFLNLFLNEKANLVEGGDLFVETKELEHYIEVKMWDNGKPMSEKFIQRIMKPFDSTGTGTEPLQLSMAVTIQMIKDINGLIRINASNGTGNEILIHLPKKHQMGNEAINV